MAQNTSAVTSMATPPPEAPSLLKEEKPQLPASPNGAPVEESDHRAYVISPLDCINYQNLC